MPRSTLAAEPPGTRLAKEGRPRTSVCVASVVGRPHRPAVPPPSGCHAQARLHTDPSLCSLTPDPAQRQRPQQAGHRGAIHGHAATGFQASGQDGDMGQDVHHLVGVGEAVGYRGWRGRTSDGRGAGAGAARHTVLPAANPMNARTTRRVTQAHDAEGGGPHHAGRRRGRH